MQGAPGSPLEASGGVAGRPESGGAFGTLYARSHSKDWDWYGRIHHATAAFGPLTCADHRLLLPSGRGPLHAGQDSLCKCPLRPLRNGGYGV